MRHRLRSDGSAGHPEEWLVAESLDGKRTYLMHLRWPRFVGRVFDEEDDEGVLDTLSVGLPDGQSLAEIIWLDPVDLETHPAESALVDLARRAGEALAEYDRRLGLEDD